MIGYGAYLALAAAGLVPYIYGAEPPPPAPPQRSTKEQEMDALLDDDMERYGEIFMTDVREGHGDALSASG